MSKRRIHLVEEESSFINDGTREANELIAEEHNWKNIIFTPFNRFWETCLVLTIVMNSNFIIYNFAYTRKFLNKKTFYFFLHYLFEIMYFFDTIFFIMHR